MATVATAADKNEEIGACRCPICGSSSAHLRLSGKSKLVYVVCNVCNSQTFARSDRSDELLRERLVPAAAAAQPAPPEPVPELDAKAWTVSMGPPPEPVAEPKPVRTNVPAVRTAPPPARPPARWGFSSWNA